MVHLLTPTDWVGSRLAFLWLIVVWLDRVSISYGSGGLYAGVLFWASQRLYGMLLEHNVVTMRIIYRYSSTSLTAWNIFRALGILYRRHGRKSHCNDSIVSPLPSARAPTLSSTAPLTPARERLRMPGEEGSQFSGRSMTNPTIRVGRKIGRGSYLIVHSSRYWKMHAEAAFRGQVAIGLPLAAFVWCCIGGGKLPYVRYHTIPYTTSIVLYGTVPRGSVV